MASAVRRWTPATASRLNEALWALDAQPQTDGAGPHSGAASGWRNAVLLQFGLARVRHPVRGPRRGEYELDADICVTLPGQGCDHVIPDGVHGRASGVCRGDRDFHPPAVSYTH